jgi:GNAT superfamily N-acetyltransferase
MSSEAGTIPLVSVRNADSDDAEAIARLSGQLGYPASAADIERRLRAIATDAAAVLVAESSPGRVVGWVHVRVLPLLTRDRGAEIGGLVVDEGHRGSGIGRQLLTAAERWARGQKAESLRLRSNIVRDDAHTFYRRCGFAASKTSLLFTKTL